MWYQPCQLTSGGDGSINRKGVTIPVRVRLKRILVGRSSPLPVTCFSEYLLQDTSSGEKLGRGRERKRKREKLENREILSCLERKCPVENVPFLHVERISLEKRESL
jgi:hypothetical protein